MMWCNVCQRDNDHEVASSHEANEYYGAFVELAFCKGCKSPTMITKKTVENDFQKFDIIKTYPPRLWAKIPEWLPYVQELNPDLYDILREVYSATHPRQVRLLSMGVRTAVDMALVGILEEDYGKFESKLDMAVQKGFLSSAQKEMLVTVIDAGSAAAHRGFKPKEELQRRMLEIMEGLIREHYITKPMLKELQKHIPPRPPVLRPEKGDKK